MSIVHIDEFNKVTDLIPEYATPVEYWYGEKFAKNCIQTIHEVHLGWIYNHTSKTFSPPQQSENGKVTLEGLQEENKLLRAQLQAQTERSDFIEDCIAEMATVVYGGV